MTQQEAEQLISSNSKLVNNTVRFKNDIWKLVSLYPDREPNSDDYSVIAVLEQGPSINTDVRYFSTDEFDLK